MMYFAATVFPAPLSPLETKHHKTVKQDEYTKQGVRDVKLFLVLLSSVKGPPPLEVHIKDRQMQGILEHSGSSEGSRKQEKELAMSSVPLMNLFPLLPPLPETRCYICSLLFQRAHDLSL